MTVVPVTRLDTSALPPQERDVGTREFFATVADLDVMEHACPPEFIRTRVRALGLDTFQLNVTDGPWLHFGLDQPATTEAISIAAQVSGQTITSEEFDEPQPNAQQAALHVLRALIKSFGSD